MSAATSNAERVRARRADAMAQGLCQQCMCRRRKDGCVTCQHCLDALYARRVRRRIAGICERCSKVAVNGSRHCAKHLAYSNMLKERRVERLIESGLCRRCAQPSAAGKTHCGRCLLLLREYARETYEKRKTLGLCVVDGCDNNADVGRVHCGGCLKKLRARVA